MLLAMLRLFGFSCSAVVAAEKVREELDDGFPYSHAVFLQLFLINIAPGRFCLLEQFSAGCLQFFTESGNLFFLRHSKIDVAEIDHEVLDVRDVVRRQDGVKVVVLQHILDDLTDVVSADVTVVRILGFLDVLFHFHDRSVHQFIRIAAVGLVFLGYCRSDSQFFLGDFHGRCIQCVS